MRYWWILAVLVLTRPDGFPVYVKSEAVEFITPVIKGHADPRANTEIALQSGNKLYVREAADDVYHSVEW